MEKFKSLEHYILLAKYSVFALAKKVKSSISLLLFYNVLKILIKNAYYSFIFYILITVILPFLIYRFLGKLFFII